MSGFVKIINLLLFSIALWIAASQSGFSQTQMLSTEKLIGGAKLIKELQFLDSLKDLKEPQLIDTLVKFLKNDKLEDSEFVKIWEFALKNIRNSNNDSIIASGYFDLAKIAENKSKFVEAKELLVLSLAKYTEMNDTSQIAFVNMNLGKLEIVGGNFESATNYLLTAAKLYSASSVRSAKAPPPAQLGHTYTMLGNILKELKKNNDAIEYYLLADKVYRQRNDSSSIAGVSNNIGLVYEKDSLFNDALRYYQIAEALAKKLRNEHLRSIVLINLGSVTLKLNQTGKAESYFLEALALSQSLNRKKGIVTSSMNLGNIQYLKKNYALSADYYVSALKIAQEIGETLLIAEIYKNLSATYEEKSDFRNALKYARLHFAMKDSIFNIESNEIILELNAKYKTELKERELQELKLKEASDKVERQKYFIIIIIMGIVIAIVIAVVYIKLYYIMKKLVADLTKAKEEAEKR